MALILENDNNERLMLAVGDYVNITTDDTDFDKHIKGEITFLNEQNIEVNDNNELIPFDYILEIEKTNE